MSFDDKLKLMKPYKTHPVHSLEGVKSVVHV